MIRYAQDNLGVKKVSAPSKNPAKCPIICFASKIKIISWTLEEGATIVRQHWFIDSYIAAYIQVPYCTGLLEYTRLV